MSDTPRTDAVQDELINEDTYTSWLEMSQTARQLERELNAANARIDLLEACNADVARIAEERNEALDRIKRLEEALENISKELPAHDGSGGLFWPMFDGEGNEIGVQQVDPITVIGAMHARAMDALYGEDTKEDKP